VGQPKKPQIERRSVRRYKLTLLATIRRIPTLTESDLLYGKTRDISTRGLYFTTYQELAPETKIHLSLYFPNESNRFLFTAEAKVLRVQKEREDEVESFGVAALIEKLGIFRPEPDRA
jgi:c-di-GMP-binding flagellar brake protein YcgR